MCAPIAKIGYGNAVVPCNPGRARDVRTGIDVPRAAAVGIAFARRIAPAGIGDHMAVLAEQRLDRIENRAIADDRLAQRAAIEHLVAEVVVFFDRSLAKRDRPAASSA